MPNYCDYDMKVVSKSKDSIDKLFSIMDYKDKTRQMYRVLDVNMDKVEREGNLFSCLFGGNVAWSCLYWVEKYDKDLSILPELCKELGIGIELWSSEVGVGFQEHYVINKDGVVVVKECVDYREECNDDGEVINTQGGFDNYGWYHNAENILLGQGVE